MPQLKRLNEHFITYSKAYNILCQVALSLLSCLLYVLIFLLYLKPNAFAIESLLNPLASGPSPQVLISISVAILAAATSSWTTRCIEHYFWLRLGEHMYHGHRPKGMKLGEIKQLALWTVSPLSRMLYIFSGERWTVRVAGLLLFATVTVNTVLLAGISTRVYTQTVTWGVPRDEALLGDTQYAGWFTTANNRYRGGQYRDIPTEVAATVFLSNLTAPAAQTDCGTETSCTCTARVATLRAQCDWKSYPNINLADPAEVETFEEDSGKTIDKLLFVKYKSRRSPGHDVILLRSSSPFVFANFSSAYVNGKMERGFSSNSGNEVAMFAHIFGAWALGGEFHSDRVSYPSETVDCMISFGNVTLEQSGNASPTLNGSTFEPSTRRLTEEPGLAHLGRIYGESNRSPFSFIGSAVGTGANSLYDLPVAYLLFGAASDLTGEMAARRIEKVYEMATLMAWTRMPENTDSMFRGTRTYPKYVYDSRYLLILLIPVGAALFGGWGKWRMGDSKTVPGYDPMVIASKGPVLGVERLRDGLSPEDEKRRVGTVGIDDGLGGQRSCFAAHDAITFPSHIAHA